MSIATPYPAQLDFDADRHIARWRPLVQWYGLRVQLYVGRLTDRYPPFSLSV